MLHIGFTGTRKGMTEVQEDRLIDWLSRVIDIGFEITGHHGDCVGADKQFDSMVRQLGGLTHLHPPTNPKHRAFCKHYSKIESARPYLERNKRIVNASNIMIATPAESKMQLRSGTWSTVRYSISRGRPINLFLPDGPVIFNWKDA